MGYSLNIRLFFFFLIHPVSMGLDGGSRAVVIGNVSSQAGSRLLREHLYWDWSTRRIVGGSYSVDSCETEQCQLIWVNETIFVKKKSSISFCQATMILKTNPKKHNPQQAIISSDYREKYAQSRVLKQNWQLCIAMYLIGI